MGDHEISGVIDDLERGYDGDAWHGPPLRKVLDGVTADVAAARPIPGGHSIREIVAHLAAWDEVVARRIQERRAIESPDEGDFPPVGDAADAWDTVLTRLDKSHELLLQAVASLDAARMRETVAGNDYPVDHMLRGALQHMAYHAGQIALIRKLVESRGR